MHPLMNLLSRPLLSGVNDAFYDNFTTVYTIFLTTFRITFPTTCCTSFLMTFPASNLTIRDDYDYNFTNDFINDFHY